MNLLNKLSRESLRLNKKRTISTIIAITLSVALICAVITMFKSFGSTFIAAIKEGTGDWHIKVSSQKYSVKDYKAKDDIEDVFVVNKVGYAKIKDGESKSNKEDFFMITNLNKSAFSKKRLDLIKGHYPSNSNEILVTNSFLSKSAKKEKIGSKIHLDYYRTLPKEMMVEQAFEMKSKDSKIQKMNRIVYNINQKNKEFLEKNSYKIVGIIDGNDSLINGIKPEQLIITTKLSKSYNALGEDIYLKLKNSEKSKEIAKELFGKNYKKNNNVEFNNELIQFETFDFSKSTFKFLYTIIGIILGIIVISSIVVIRNSFAIATTEKMKQYGFLASIGATKKQIKRNVLYEARFLATIGIPLGIVVGLAADFIIIKIINNILQGISGADENSKLIFDVSFIGILIAIVLGIITIYLSAISSARKASKVTPIDNIKKVDSIKIKAKKLKTPKWINKVFGIGGVIAYKNLKRNKKQYRTTLISIVASIVIFISMVTGMSQIMKIQSLFYSELGFNISVQGDKLNDDKLRQKIIDFEPYKSYTVVYIPKDKSNVDKDNPFEIPYLKIKDTDKINKEFKKDFIEKDGKSKDKNAKSFKIYFKSYNDEAFKRLVKKSGLNYDEVKKTGIIKDNKYEKNKDGKRIEKVFTNYKKGDKVSGLLENKPINFEIGGRIPTEVETLDGNVGFLDGIVVYVNVKYFDDIKWNVENLYIDSKNPSGVEKQFNKLDIVKEKLESGIDEFDSQDISLLNLEKVQEDMNSIMLIFKIFIYGFITIITLIGLTNIFNTITSNVELRSREFATMKSIGMTRKEFNKMVNLETVLYSIKALLIGIIISLVITYFMNNALTSFVDGLEGYIPIYPILISILAVFIFIFLIMRYSIRKIERKNIMETIRRENI